MTAWREHIARGKCMILRFNSIILTKSSPIAGELFFLNPRVDESGSGGALQMVREGLVALFPFLLRLALRWWRQQSADSPQVERCLDEVVLPF
jgi:hypothetical protein